MSTKAKTYLENLNDGPLTFSELIESLRLSEELSQVDFAKKLGISRSHLCDIEKGRKSVSAAKAAQYAEILGYSQEQFVKLSLQDEVDRAGLDFKVQVS